MQDGREAAAAAGVRGRAGRRTTTHGAPPRHGNKGRRHPHLSVKERRRAGATFTDAAARRQRTRTGARSSSSSDNRTAEQPTKNIRKRGGAAEARHTAAGNNNNNNNAYRHHHNKNKQEEMTEPTTRLIIKNLPAKLDAAALRAHIEQSYRSYNHRNDSQLQEAWIVTDAKVIKREDGVSRRFGFVGFRTIPMATAAKNHLHRTYLGSSRLDIAFAQPMGSAHIQRPWSKYSVGSSMFQQAGLAAAAGSTADEQNGRGHEGGGTKEKGHGDHGAVPTRKPPTHGGREARGSELTVNDWVRTGLSEDRAQQMVQEVKFQEFLLTMKAKTAKGRNAWNNDDVVNATKEHTAYLSRDVENEKASDEGLSTDVSRRSSGNSGSSAAEGEQSTSARSGGMAADVAVSDADYFRSKLSGNISSSNTGHGLGTTEERSATGDGGQHESGGVDKSGDSSNSNTDSGNHWKPSKDLSAKAFRSIAEGGRLLLRNLPFSATEAEISELLSPFGSLEEVHVAMDDANRSKGYAFAQFDQASDGARAYIALDGSDFQGRRLHIIAAWPKKQQIEARDDTDDTSSYKRKLNESQSAEANEAANADTANRSHWSTLFVRSDTVVEAVANKYGVGKVDVLDPSASSSGDAAVRMALAETQVIGETKQFLRDNGVHVEVFDAAAEAERAALQQLGKTRTRPRIRRSETAILVKNLPFSCSEDELYKLFSQHGAVSRVVLPPSRAVGIVEFSQGVEAKRAFRRIVYRKFHNVPLYLEWAPIGVFGQSAAHDDGAAVAGSKPLQQQLRTGVDESRHADIEMSSFETAEEEGAQSFSVFVKNISFSTTEKTLRSLFEKCGDSILSVKIPTKQRMRPDGSKEALSVGFGFVEFGQKAHAMKAVRELNRTVVDGHALKLSVSVPRKASSGRAAASAAAASSSASSSSVVTHAAGKVGISTTKLVVKNLPFQATARDLKRICSAFAEVSRVRVPKKFDGGHRGFAFVQFATKQETLSALQKLSHTHLYGRKLVFEFAREHDDDVVEVRQKTVRHLDREVQASKRKRFKA